MKFSNLVFFIIILTSTNSFSQKPKAELNGHNVTITTKNLQKEKLILFMKYGTNSQIIISDSLTIKSNDQKVVFKTNQKLIDAVYFLKLASQKNDISVVLDNNTNANFSLDDKNIENIICTQNNLNKDFIDYQKQQKTFTDNNQRIELRKSLMAKYPNSVLNLYFKIENRLFEKAPETLEGKTAFRNSFFKFIDKNDKRIFLLPNINQLLYTFTIILPVNDENYQQNIDIILKGMDCNSKNFAVYTRWFLANLSYFESKNLDLSFNYLFKNYLNPNKCKTFTDAEIAGFRNKSETNKLFPTNRITPDVVLVDKKNTEFQLSKIYPQNDFTFVAFFSPSCHHCQQAMPFANSSFEGLKAKYPNKKIQLIAVLNDSDETKWEEFITERKISSWLNLKSIDPKRKYQDDFNAYSNPNFFLIDKNGKVVLKSFNPMAIEEIIQK